MEAVDVRVLLYYSVLISLLRLMHQSGALAWHYTYEAYEDIVEFVPIANFENSISSRGRINSFIVD